MLPRLTVLIVGGGGVAAGVKRTAAETAADRAAALEFVRTAFRCGLACCGSVHGLSSGATADKYVRPLNAPEMMNVWRLAGSQHHPPGYACAWCASLCRRNPEIQDAVAALARHLCLRAPDKADNRAAAVKAAAELVVELPQWEQELFVGFVFGLSRSKQVRQPVTR